MNTAKELREMNDEQLAFNLKEAQESMFRLRFQAATEKLDTPSQMKRTRRLIARIKTIQSERALAKALS
ncbi:MAG: 50S ribosomal protein L29 [Planctomycetaceae bacterium]|nr:50S ribosomal protein L29 [Planctomycetaceae bacterium]